MEKEYLTDAQKSELCLQCQRCCKVLPLALKHSPNDKMFQEVTEYYRAHGCDLVIFGSNVIISIPHVCQHLTEGGCAIYESRPEVCRSYDGRKDPRMYKECLWARYNPRKGGMESSASVMDKAEVKIT